MKKKILILSDFYLPGFTNGGAPQMVRNIVDRFFDRYDFFVVTRNYDSRTDRRPYTGVVTDAWNQVGKAQVFYCSKKTLSSKTFSHLISEIAPDLILLNSPFSTPTILFLFLKRKKRFCDLPVIIAACGSFSVGSLSIKRVKKWGFLKFASLVGLYRGVIWKASFDLESREIKKVMGPKAIVKVAPDLMPLAVRFGDIDRPVKQPGAVKFVYFSRIERKKNLHYFLDRLRGLKEGSISLEIIGPAEDKPYWEQCQCMIAELPQNISVTESGGLPQDEALKRVAQNHFFVLPTMNENFGYACIESLAVGCPNITSDNTAWSDLEEKNAGWRVPLEDTDQWVEKIKLCLSMDQNEYSRIAEAAANFAREWLERSDTEAATDQLLRTALSDGETPITPVPGELTEHTV